MAIRIVRNSRYKTLVHATATEGAITVTGNSSVSAIGDATITDDTIVSVNIRQVWSSADSGAASNGWSVLRGANTVWFSDSTSWLDFAGTGGSLELDSTGTLALTKTGTLGTIMIELQKVYDTETSDY